MSLAGQGVHVHASTKQRLCHASSMMTSALLLLRCSRWQCYLATKSEQCLITGPLEVGLGLILPQFFLAWLALLLDPPPERAVLMCRSHY